jgi:hypothetical protein
MTSWQVRLYIPEVSIYRYYCSHGVLSPRMFECVQPHGESIYNFPTEYDVFTPEHQDDHV